MAIPSDPITAFLDHAHFSALTWRAANQPNKLVYRTKAQLRLPVARASYAERWKRELGIGDLNAGEDALFYTVHKRDEKRELAVLLYTEQPKHPRAPVVRAWQICNLLTARGTPTESRLAAIESLSSISKAHPYKSLLLSKWD
jgi:hypothetical protein